MLKSLILATLVASFGTFAGQHFRSDHNAGRTLGKRVAEFVDRTVLLQSKQNDHNSTE